MVTCSTHCIILSLVRCGSYQRMKVCRVVLEFIASMENYTKSIVLQTSQNNLGFSLCVTLSVCYKVTTSEENQSLREVSSDKKAYHQRILELKLNNIHIYQLSN